MSEEDSGLSSEIGSDSGLGSEVGSDSGSHSTWDTLALTATSGNGLGIDGASPNQEMSSNLP